MDDKGKTYDTEEECRAAIESGRRLVGKTPEGKAVVARLQAERDERIARTRQTIGLGRRAKLRRKR